MLKRIRKRDGSLQKFDKEKIISALNKAFLTTGEGEHDDAKRIGNNVTQQLERLDHAPTVEEIQDRVETSLMRVGFYRTAKKYILYREQHSKARNISKLVHDTEIVQDYINKEDWRVKENSNMTYSLQGLNNYLSSRVVSNYWLEEIYPDDIRKSNHDGNIHIHDLGTLGAYCFDDKTRVLCIDGFKPFSDVTLNDKVATYNTDNGNMEYQKPYDKQVYKYDGSLYHIDGRGIDLLVTPEHRMFVKRKSSNNWEFTTAEKLDKSSEFLKRVNWSGNEPDPMFSFPKINGGNRLRHVRIPTDLYLKFMGWWISEGSAWKNNRKDRTSSDYIISIAQMKYRNEVIDIVRDMGFSPSCGEYNIQFCSKEVYHYLKKFGISKTKYIPDNIKNMTSEKIRIFLMALFKGDGSFKDGNMTKYTTASKRLAEDVVECLLKIGKCGTIGKRENVYVVYVQNSQLTPIFRKEKKIVKYNGIVYDLSVPNGTLIVERNGKVVISGNCVGWDMRDLLDHGFNGVSGKVNCKPPKHLKVAMGQVVNFLYTLQGESAGAQAFSDVDAYLAPFISYDNISYDELKQAMQEFVFNLNVPTRTGFQSPFENFTLSLKTPSYMENEPVIIGGEYMEDTYGDFADEADMFNRAFGEVMNEGDGRGNPFSFPIPTLNITKDFDWDNENYYPLWEMTSKYGIPYFSNFVNSDMSPDDVRSMCCRLRLNKKELIKRGGGLFGANPLTGSIGVVTINMPKLGYVSKDDSDFYERLDSLMDLAKNALIIKRNIIENYSENGLYPYSSIFLRDVKSRHGKYWANHFSTIGLVGMNECLENFMDSNMFMKDGVDFTLNVLDHMNERMIDYQEETGHLFNLEATPAEGCSYRLARIDKHKYPDIITAGTDEVPYYTNSTQLPVNYTNNLFKAMTLQDDIQSKYTGGTVFHIFLQDEHPNVDSLKNMVGKITNSFKMPYFTITPTFSACPNHGYLSGQFSECPMCGERCEVYSRVVGYLRPVSQWNEGKTKEFEERKTFDFD